MRVQEQDLEDRYLAEQTVAESGSRLTSDQVRKTLGLDRRIRSGRAAASKEAGPLGGSGK
jgi:hypothetical protein